MESGQNISQDFTFWHSSIIFSAGNGGCPTTSSYNMHPIDLNGTQAHALKLNSYQKIANPINYVLP